MIIVCKRSLPVTKVTKPKRTKFHRFSFAPTGEDVTDNKKIVYQGQTKVINENKSVAPANPDQLGLNSGTNAVPYKAGDRKTKEGEVVGGMEGSKMNTRVQPQGEKQ
jgi:hypothetical protein